MMFIKAVDGEIYGSPISEKELRVRYSNISFPKEILQEHITQLDYYIVQDGTKPNPTRYQIMEQGPIEFTDGVYKTTWILSDMTDEEKQFVDDEEAKKIRNVRDELLMETDWRFRSDMNPSQEWIDYCQALRDITAQPGFPYDITWPTKPA